jgi:hypothetical protein
VVAAQIVLNFVAQNQYKLLCHVAHVKMVHEYQNCTAKYPTQVRLSVSTAILFKHGTVDRVPTAISMYSDRYVRIWFMCWIDSTNRIDSLDVFDMCTSIAKSKVYFTIFRVISESMLPLSNSMNAFNTDWKAGQGSLVYIHHSMVVQAERRHQLIQYSYHQKVEKTGVNWVSIALHVPGSF